MHGSAHGARVPLSIPARKPRRSAAFKLAAREKGEFGEKLPSGWPRHCIAPELQHHVAMVADVAVACDGVLKVDHVVAAVEGGITVTLTSCVHSPGCHRRGLS